MKSFEKYCVETFTSDTFFSLQGIIFGTSVAYYISSFTNHKPELSTKFVDEFVAMYVLYGFWLFIVTAYKWWKQK